MTNGGLCRDNERVSIEAVSVSNRTRFGTTVSEAHDNGVVGEARLDMDRARNDRITDFEFGLRGNLLTASEGA